MKQTIELIIFTVIMTLIWIYGEKPEGSFEYIRYMMICYVFYAGYIQHKQAKQDPIEKEESRKKTTIVSTYITDVTYVQKGGLSGSLLGSHFFGLLGGIIGYELSKYDKPHYIYFNVTYLDNHSEIIKTKYRSHKYKKLMTYCINDI